MNYLMIPYSTAIEPFVWWQGAFTDSELDWLQNKAKNATAKAQVGGGRVEPEIRRSEVDWLPCNPDTEWVFDKFAEIGAKLNAKHYGFDLTCFTKELQLTNYDQTENGMYGWHQDYGAGESRKLSIVMQLSDPSEYEGGNLQVMTASEPINVRKQRGLITVFPSYTLHQVTPVTQGTRQSLVAWILGPRFK